MIIRWISSLEKCFPEERVYEKRALTKASMLKNERYSRFTFKARAEARMSAIWYMESLYNRMRPHSGVGWRKPAESMEDFFTRFYAGREEVKRAA